MPHEPAKLLQDLLDAGRAIERFVDGRTIEDYDDDLMLRSAVERQFEIIGEACRRLTSLDATLSSRLPSMPRIIAFRNIIAHGYDVVDSLIVWQIIQDDLPQLLQCATEALAGFDAGR